MQACARAIRSVVTVSCFTLLSGCGTFQLASDVRPLSSKTQEQQQLDNLACKDQARLAANTAERQTGAFLLGMTIVGAPVAFELEKAKQREVFKSCMEAKGYRVLPPADQASAQPAPISPDPAKAPPVPPAAPTATSMPSVAPAPGPSATPSSAPTGARDEAMQLQKLKELLDKGLITQEEYEKKRKEVLDRL